MGMASRPSLIQSFRILLNKKPQSVLKALLWGGDPAGARTQDPRLKRALLYQLSYRIISIKKGGLLSLPPAKSGCKFRQSKLKCKDIIFFIL